ncbi:hypothetical protein CI109_104696 [Kwoniella shandongensis]|uniref:Uncharacterized protein n=1 Tax=Kwoniella shandongensis TaxID=1734106 RepID=A0AAJ8LN25_9TREE
MTSHSAAQGLAYPQPATLCAPLTTEETYPYAWGWGLDPPKRGFCDRLFGDGQKKVVWDDQYGYGYGYAPPVKHKIPKATPVYGKPIPQLTEVQTTATPALVPQRIKPLPNNWEYLDRSTRKKLLREQEKEVKRWEKMNKEQMKLLAKSMKLKEKEERTKRKREEKERKAREKEMLWHLRHPGAPLPRLPPEPTAPSQPTATPAAQPASAPTPGGQPMSFMLLPTLEEYGVRRPFDAPGVPGALGGAGTWPMMSRTLSHAIVDMTREERVHSIQKGILNA